MVLTTTVDGLWVLQVLAGIEMLAPELGLRPTLPRVETTQLALAHPVAAELQAHGVIDAARTVDQTVREWLTVLARRDIALLLRIQAPHHDGAQAVLTRFAQWWVFLERSGEVLRLGGAGTTTSEAEAGAVLHDQIDRLCGAVPPAQFRPVDIDTTPLKAAATSPDSLHAHLTSQALAADHLRILLSATDPDQSSQTSITAGSKPGDPPEPTSTPARSASSTPRTGASSSNTPSRPGANRCSSHPEPRPTSPPRSTSCCATYPPTRNGTPTESRCKSAELSAPRCAGSR